MKIVTLLRTLMAATTLAITMPSVAQISINISIAPPVPIYESAPMMAPGYVWAPGYWAWHDDHHVWIRGRSIVQRVGYRWEPDRWEQRGNGYYRQPGNWIRTAYYAPVPMDKVKKPKHWKSDKHGRTGQGGKKGQGKKNDD